MPGITGFAAKPDCRPAAHSQRNQGRGPQLCQALYSDAGQVLPLTCNKKDPCIRKAALVQP
jgi:hypothetical protein